MARRKSESPPPPGDRAMREAGFDPGFEHVARDLDAYFQHYQQNMSPYVALEALGLLTFREANEKDFVDEPNRNVSVPWWVVCAIGIAWQRYRRPEEGSERPSLEEAFGIKNKGRGRITNPAQDDQDMKEKNLTLEILNRLNRDPSLKEADAILDVADERGIPESTIRDYVKRQREVVIEVMRRRSLIGD